MVVVAALETKRISAHMAVYVIVWGNSDLKLSRSQALLQNGI
jgi:hypothetical protein